MTASAPVTCTAARRVFGREGRDGAVVAVDHVTHQFAAHRLHAITGPSGSGKSTLLHLLAGLDRPDAGEVTLLGQSTRTLRERKLCALRQRHVGVVFQRFNLVPTLTAAENITLPSALAGLAPDPAWIEHLVRRLGLAERLQHTPAELSGGQQQRVAVARALAMRPAVIFADEPTGSLDRDSARRLVRLLRELAEDRVATFIVVTHDEHLTSAADEVLRLVDGRADEPDVAVPPRPAHSVAVREVPSTAIREPEQTASPLADPEAPFSAPEAARVVRVE